MICGKILSVSKAFVRFRPAVRRGRLSPLWDAGGMTKNARVCKASRIFADYGGDEGGLSPLWDAGGMTKNARVCKASRILADYGGDEGGLSPPLSYRRGRSHRILRKGAQACGNELLWRRGI